MVSAAAVFAPRVRAPRRLPRVKIDDVGVFEHVADAHVDTLAGGGRAQSAQKLRHEEGPVLLFGEATHEGSPLICGNAAPPRLCDPPCPERQAGIGPISPEPKLPDDR